VKNVLDGKFDEACSGLKQLYDLGYSPTDIITTLFRVVKNYDMAEYLKLEFLKVNTVLLLMWLTVLSLSCAG
jgi:replication factor C subunit 2/4